MITLIIISLSIIKASAYSGYAGADGGLVYATLQAEKAQYYLDRAGYSTSLYSGSAYTKSSVSSVVPLVRAFYVSCHGGTSGSSFYTNNASEKVSSSEMYSWTRGFYKFVFIDACFSADSKQMYSAFNMVDGDGKTNAYLGWRGTSQDSGSYYTFSNTVYERLTAGDTINDAVWLARSRTGITNYQIYGNYNTTMYN